MIMISLCDEGIRPNKLTDKDEYWPSYRQKLLLVFSILFSLRRRLGG